MPTEDAKNTPVKVPVEGDKNAVELRGGSGGAAVPAATPVFTDGHYKNQIKAAGYDPTDEMIAAVKAEHFRVLTPGLIARVFSAMRQERRKAAAANPA